jgi:hypothetical protein
VTTVHGKTQPELIHADGCGAVAIYCRHGGVLSTSSGDDPIWSRVLEPFSPRSDSFPWRKGRPWLQIVTERVLPSSWPSLLGGDASRTPTSGVGGAQGLDCKFSFGSRVLGLISRYEIF